jgi:hypothetical protein
MWLLLSVVAASATAYLIARLLVSTPILIQPHVTVAFAAPVPEPLDSLPAPPESVLMYCASETEQWAREQLLSDAHVLYRDYGDWDQVLQALRKQTEGVVVLHDTNEN